MLTLVRLYFVLHQQAKLGSKGRVTCIHGPRGPEATAQSLVSLWSEGIIQPSGLGRPLTLAAASGVDWPVLGSLAGLSALQSLVVRRAGSAVGLGGDCLVG